MEADLRSRGMAGPGGYLQWGDPDCETIRVDKTRPETNTESLTELYGLMPSQDPRMKPTWVKDLPNRFASVGFVDIETDRQDFSPLWAFLMHEAGLMIHEIMYRKTKNEKMQQKLGELIPRVADETKSGAYATSIRLTVVGRKPLV
jgi:hypothetical protein